MGSCAGACCLTMVTNTGLLAVLALAPWAHAGLVKRDTMSELTDISNSIGNSIKDMVGLETNKDIIDDIKDIDNEKFCVTDAQCLEHIQFCNINNNLYGVCTFHVRNRALDPWNNGN